MWSAGEIGALDSYKIIYSTSKLCGISGEPISGIYPAHLRKRQEKDRKKAREAGGSFNTVREADDQIASAVNDRLGVEPDT